MLHEHDKNNVLVFLRAGLVFAFNFHPTNSYTDYRIGTSPGQYEMILNSDDRKYGGHHRLEPNQTHFTIFENKKAEKIGENFLSLYLPTRTVIVLAQSS